MSEAVGEVGVEDRENAALEHGQLGLGLGEVRRHELEGGNSDLRNVRHEESWQRLGDELVLVRVECEGWDREVVKGPDRPVSCGALQEELSDHKAEAGKDGG